MWLEVVGGAGWGRSQRALLPGQEFKGNEKLWGVLHRSKISSDSRCRKFLLATSGEWTARKQQWRSGFHVSLRPALSSSSPSMHCSHIHLSSLEHARLLPIAAWNAVLLAVSVAGSLLPVSSPLRCDLRHPLPCLGTCSAVLVYFAP